MKQLLSLLTVAVAALGFAAPAAAWPDKPVTVVVPFPPGGSTDTLARALTQQMQTKLGQPFIVDNRAGATGTVGAGQVARAAADGHTMLVASLGPFAIAPHLLKSVPYDANKDLEMITVAVQAPNVLVVPANSPHKTLADVVAFLRANPGKMSFASSGSGSSDHLTAELFWQQTATQAIHVPYKGGAPAIADLLGGQVEASFQNINAIIQHIRAGKLKALAITSERRSPLLPDLPTMTEAGSPGVVVYSWQGVAVPSGVSADVKKKVHAAVVDALAAPAVRSSFVDVGFEIVGSSPEQATAFQRDEWARWKKVIQTGGITAN